VPLYETLIPRTEGSAASRASGVQVVVGVDPADAIEVVTDPVADLNRVAAVVALALVPGGRRDVLTDLRTGTGVVADAVVAPVARQVGDQAHVILAAGFHTAGFPRSARSISREQTSVRPSLQMPYRDSQSSRHRPPACGNAARVGL